MRQLDEKEEKLEKKITNLKEKRDKLKIKHSKGSELEKKYDNRRRAYERILINLDYKFKELQRRLTELNTLIEDLGVGEKRIKRIEDVNEILTYLEKEKDELEEASKYSETRYYTHIESYKMYSIRRNELLKNIHCLVFYIILV